ncbi:MAG: 50S ribosomal protein L21e [Halobacteria archaeon]|nr:50S ribosomal protein L21e [Halobacteria archaeon]
MPNSKGERQDTRDKLSNDSRERGTSPPSQAVQEFEEGARVHIDIDPSVPEGRPHPKFQGHTGTVVGKQGRAFVVEIEDIDKQKEVIVRPHHLQPQ